MRKSPNSTITAPFRLTGRALAFTLFKTLTAASLTAVVVPGCPPPDRPGFEKVDIPPELGARKGAVGRAGPEALLAGGRARGRVGDWVVRNKAVAAVFRQEDGRLMDLAFRKDGTDLFSFMTTTASDTRGQYPVYYHLIRRVKPSGRKPAALEMKGRVRDKDLNLEVITRVWTPGPGASVLVFHSRLRNAGRKTVFRAGIGDEIYLGNSRIFVPGYGWVRESDVLHAHWTARAAPGFVIGLASAEKDPMQLRFKMGYQGYNPSVRATHKVAHLATGQSIEAREAWPGPPRRCKSCSAAPWGKYTSGSIRPDFRNRRLKPCGRRCSGKNGRSFQPHSNGAARRSRFRPGTATMSGR
jgi:hypothetical protein